MGRLTIVLFPLMIAALLLGANCSDDEEHLIRHLFQRGAYAKDVRPAENATDPVKIYFGLAPINILEIKHNRRSSDVDVQSWYRFLWHDYRLQWSPEDFGGIAVLRVPNSNVWKPDLIIFNGLDSNHVYDPVYNAVVYSTGDVLWIPTKTDKIRCANIGEDLECRMKYGSWSYDGNKVHLAWYEGQEKLDLSDFNTLSDYRVRKNAGEYKNVYYPCCEEPYPFIAFNFTLSPY